MTAERFVLDASVSLEWFLPDGQGSAGYAADVLAAIESELTALLRGHGISQVS